MSLVTDPDPETPTVSVNCGSKSATTDFAASIVSVQSPEVFVQSPLQPAKTDAGIGDRMQRDRGALPERRGAVGGRTVDTGRDCW